MLRVQLEIDGEVLKEWPIDDNDYVINNTTATATAMSFTAGQTHCHLMYGNSDYNYTYNKTNGDVFDGCTNDVSISYPIFTVDTSGATVYLTTSGFATMTANLTISFAQAPLINKYAFYITQGYTP